jgi:hypothetical protein
MVRLRVIFLCLSLFALEASCASRAGTGGGGLADVAKVQRDTPASPASTGPSTRFSDPASDLFDAKGEPKAGEGYLDIRESVVSLEPGGRYRLVLTLAAPIPDQVPDPSLFFEWDLLLENDACRNNDKKWGLVWNDLRPEYMVRFRLGESGPKAEVIDLRDGRSTPLEYTKDGERLEIRFTSEQIGKPERFDYTLATRGYGEKGAPSALQLADKAPDARHYQFPEGKEVAVDPGLPSLTLETTSAILRFNPGDEARAKWLGEAWEMGYAALGRQLGVYPKKKMTLYVYRTQQDLLQGLSTFGGFSPDSTGFFKTSGAPRPIHYDMHVPPDSGGRELFHEYTHTLLEELSGKAYASIKWLDEGLAEHMAQTTVLQTACNDRALGWSQSKLSLVKQALAQGKLPRLKEISSEIQWSQLARQGQTWLIYAEGYALVSHLVATHGLDACLSVLKKMSQGLDQEAAVQAAFGEPLAQMEDEFRSWVAQSN